MSPFSKATLAYWEKAGGEIVLFAMVFGAIGLGIGLALASLDVLDAPPWMLAAGILVGSLLAATRHRAWQRAAERVERNEP